MAQALRVAQTLGPQLREAGVTEVLLCQIRSHDGVAVPDRPSGTPPPSLQLHLALEMRVLNALKTQRAALSKSHSRKP
ncbi:MAG TPA: hypothetical protein VMB82_09305 [Acidimicrobiales bacterium]|nr:hypothetical protein [Acidimicrobiales bacterium]